MKFYAFIKFICNLPFRILYPLKKIGNKNLPKKGRFVLACNHYSFADIPILMVHTKKHIHFIAKKELFKKGFIGFLCKNFQAIPANRDGSDVETLKKSVKYLKEDRAIGIFPEGTRNERNDEAMSSLKAGALAIANFGKAPIYCALYYRRPRIFRKNYMIIGNELNLGDFYENKPTGENMEKAVAIFKNEFEKLRTELDDFVESKKRRRKKHKKDIEEKK